MSGGVLTPSFWCVVYIQPECRLIWRAYTPERMAFRVVNDLRSDLPRSNPRNRDWQVAAITLFRRASTLCGLLEAHNAAIAECNRSIFRGREPVIGRVLLSRVTRDDSMLIRNYNRLNDDVGRFSVLAIHVDRGGADGRTLAYMEQFVNKFQECRDLFQRSAALLLRGYDMLDRARGRS